MLDGINDFAEYESQQRWIIRRCVFAVLFLIGSYFLCWIPSEYFVNTRPSPAIARWKPFIVASYRPLNALRKHARQRNYWTYNTIAMPFISLTEWGCRHVDQTATTWARNGCPISARWVAAGLIALVAAYGLSPIPVLWWIKFLGIERVALTARLYEFYYAPIEWLSDHSATVRSFYENYAELFALTD